MNYDCCMKCEHFGWDELSFEDSSSPITRNQIICNRKYVDDVMDTELDTDKYNRWAETIATSDIVVLDGSLAVRVIVNKGFQPPKGCAYLLEHTLDKQKEFVFKKPKNFRKHGL